MGGGGVSKKQRELQEKTYLLQKEALELQKKQISELEAKEKAKKFHEQQLLRQKVFGRGTGRSATILTDISEEQFRAFDPTTMTSSDVPGAIDTIRKQNTPSKKSPIENPTQSLPRDTKGGGGPIRPSPFAPEGRFPRDVRKRRHGQTPERTNTKGGTLK